MNKPLLIVLLLVAIALGAYVLTRGETDPAPEPDLPVASGPVIGTDVAYDPETLENGIEIHEEPNFDVQITLKEKKAQRRIEFAITETHGWAVTMVYVRAWHRSLNEETGEWQRDMEVPVKHMCQSIVNFGETLTQETALTDFELSQFDCDEMNPEHWVGEVYKYRKVFKPKS